MSLQGSLETFALPDVLVLLASTKKDGELRVVGGKVDGRIWVEKGQIVHSDVNGREVESVDAVFELLRLDSGTFSFGAESDPPRRHDADMVDLVLADAQVRLSEWNEIAKVVPHLDVLVDMAPEAPDDEVVVTASDWRLLRAVAGGRTVNELMAKLGLAEFDTCKTVKELLDARLVSVDLTAKPKSAAAERPVERAPSRERAERAELDERDELDARDGSDEPERVVRPERVERAEARRERDKTDAERELEALADEAARPRKVRATTSGPGAPQPPEPAGSGRTAKPAAAAAHERADEAKALVAQLAALEGENEEKIAKKVEEHLARGGELPEVPEGDEPINRGLLLKFLSSVRN